jgi:hypothetical protein
MADEIIIKEPIVVNPIAIKPVEITKEEFVAMADADKIKVLVAEKEAELEAKDLAKLKDAFYEAERETLAGFDEDAKNRLGAFESQLSVERTAVEKKFKDAEETGTWEIPL